MHSCGDQSFTLKMYPAELSLTAWICLMGMVEGSIVSLIMERDLSVWVIGWDSRLLAAVYSVSSLQSIKPFLLQSSCFTFQPYSYIVNHEYTKRSILLLKPDL